MRRVHIVVEFDESVCIKVGSSTNLMANSSHRWFFHRQRAVPGSPPTEPQSWGRPCNGVNHLGYMRKYTKRARSEHPNVSSTSFPGKPYSGNARESGMICPGQLLDSKFRALFLKCWSGDSAICVSFSISDWSLHHLSISICY